ncbi:MAG: hypothetical protein KF787_02975 [Phycisphaeraceae bacterium]|nr:hypothetical protein [Phycisphaerae bacterium]MBX3391590.1 hypothetical protein [Phycisphaeraceae bacterium]HRJ49702.1 hypothetical protein [Phycisphaerales bacterium]
MTSGADTTTDSSAEPSGSPRSPAGLIAVNALLVVVLALVTLAGPTPASAESGGTEAASQPSARPPARARGEYTVISPKSSDGNTGVLVVIDSVNEEMAVLDWDKTRRTLVVTGFRDLTADSTEVIGR